MIRKNKWKLILTSAVILLPVVAGMILWNRLPEQVPTHFNFAGEPDQWSSKGFAVFGLPLLVLAMHWLCVVFTGRDHKNRNQNSKIVGVVLWICPVVSVFCGAIMYAYALGFDFNMNIAGCLLMAVAFGYVGNYLPKCRQNYTIGIKVKWTLESEENWHASHRFGGRVFTVCALAFLVGAFLPEKALPWLMGLTLPVMIIAPIAYSYIFYKKHK